LRLVHIDDVVAAFVAAIFTPDGLPEVPEAVPVHETTVGALAVQISAFRRVRDSLIVESVGQGLVRKLYSTYVSYLEPVHFTYTLPMHRDERGVFVEMLKTEGSGQVSFFTAHPGVTRGGHYHHSKTEKFLVLAGTARFRFRHILTDEVHEVVTAGGEAVIVETIPGWAHDITNVGDIEMIVMLWANEVFDPAHPDTFACSV